MSNYILSNCEDTNVLTKEQEAKYIEQCKNGDESARDKLVYHNFRFVKYIAKKYENSNIELDDLESIGLIGLIKAVDTYNADKGAKLSTYAATCIENEIRMELRKRKIETVSFDELLSVTVNGEELRFEDVIENKNINFVSELENKEEKNILKKIVMSLPEMDSNIIIKYFGFDNDIRMTQKEIGDLLGISQSYVSRKVKSIGKKIRKKIEQIELVNNELLLMEGSFSMKYECTSACADLKVKKNKIEILVTKLTEEEKRLFKLRYGTDYENDVEEVNWGPNDYINFKYELYPKLKELLKTIKINRAQSLRKRLGCKEEELEAILSKLNDAEKALLGLNCGVDLEHPKRSEYCSKKDKERFNDILIPRMKDLLKEIRKENKNNKKLNQINRENNEDKKVMTEKSVIKETDDENISSKPKHSKQIIPAYKIIGCSKEQLMLAIPLITDRQRNLFYKANGDDIDHPKRSENCTKKDLNNYYQNVIQELRCKVAYNIIRKVDLKHKTGGKAIPAYELIGCYREELLAELPNLTVRQKELFNLANGDDIDHPKRSGNFTKKDSINYFTNVIKTLRNKIAINIIKNSRNEDVKQNTVENPNPEKHEDLTKEFKKDHDNMLPKNEVKTSVKLPQSDITDEEKEPVIDFIPKKEEKTNSDNIPSKCISENDYNRLLNIMSLMQLSKKDSAILLKRILLAYKEKMGEFIDDVIGIIMDDASKEDSLDSSNKGPYQKNENNIS